MPAECCHQKLGTWLLVLSYDCEAPAQNLWTAAVYLEEEACFGSSSLHMIAGYSGDTAVPDFIFEAQFYLYLFVSNFLWRRVKPGQSVAERFHATRGPSDLCVACSFGMRICFTVKAELSCMES